MGFSSDSGGNVWLRALDENHIRAVWRQRLRWKRDRGSDSDAGTRAGSVWDCNPAQAVNPGAACNIVIEHFENLCVDECG
jgi:hypothetical protein